MKLLIIVACIIACASCTVPLSQTNYNPLDSPGQQANESDLHAKNMEWIKRGY